MPNSSGSHSYSSPKLGAAAIYSTNSPTGSPRPYFAQQLSSGTLSPYRDASARYSNIGSPRISSLGRDATAALKGSNYPTSSSRPNSPRLGSRSPSPSSDSGESSGSSSQASRGPADRNVEALQRPVLSRHGSSNRSNRGEVSSHYVGQDLNDDAAAAGKATLLLEDSSVSTNCNLSILKVSTFFPPSVREPSFALFLPCMFHLQQPPLSVPVADFCDSSKHLTASLPSLQAFSAALPSLFVCLDRSHWAIAMASHRSGSYDRLIFCSRSRRPFWHIAIRFNFFCVSSSLLLRAFLSVGCSVELGCRCSWQFFASTTWWVPRRQLSFSGASLQTVCPRSLKTSLALRAQNADDLH